MQKLKAKDVYSIEVIKSKAVGYFFSAGAMKGFKSRVSELIYQGVESVYFVTSERYGENPRRYTVRRFDLNTLGIETVSEFYQLNKGAAHGAASRLAQKEKSQLDAKLTAFERDLKNL